jgi:hypothetical protein
MPHPQYIILVGGFGESPYLKSKLAEFFGYHGAFIVTAEEPSYVFHSGVVVHFSLYYFTERRPLRE